MTKNLVSGKRGRQTSFVERSSFELPKPHDWQMFERLCVLLFRAELNDPNAARYGGEKQLGIDILGYRNGNPSKAVWVQCRNVKTALVESNILKACEASLELQANLHEVIFATTAPNRAKTTDAAIRVERTLRARGYNIAVQVYGWPSLQEMICRHDDVHQEWVRDHLRKGIACGAIYV